MKKFSFYMPPAGYVSKPAELVIFFLFGLVLMGGVIFSWSGIVDIPPVPKRLVLRSAQVAQPLVMSRGKVDLYFNVSSDEGGYKHRMEVLSRDVEPLKVRKGESLWVALDADSNNPFVWAVYDEEFNLIVGQQQIVWGRRYVNGGYYFAFVGFGLSVMYCLYFLVREVWNGFFYRKDG